jgi:hypothetical protein
MALSLNLCNRWRSGEIHALPTLPLGKEAIVYTGREAGRGPDDDVMAFERKTSAPAGNYV